MRLSDKTNQNVSPLIRQTEYLSIDKADILSNLTISLGIRHVNSMCCDCLFGCLENCMFV